jgi:hypothetical protein
MIKGFSDKIKFYMLMGAFIILLIICYNIAFKSTLQSARNCSAMQEKARLASDMPKNEANLRNQLSMLNKKYFNGNRGLNDAHEVILEKLSKLSSEYSTTVVGYPERHLVEASFIQAETHMAILKGGFINLLKVLYQLEVNERVGRLASAGFYTETDFKTKVTNLYLRIYIQNFRNLKKNDTQ